MTNSDDTDIQSDTLSELPDTDQSEYDVELPMILRECWYCGEQGAPSHGMGSPCFACEDGYFMEFVGIKMMPFYNREAAARYIEQYPRVVALGDTRDALWNVSSEITINVGDREIFSG